MGAGKEMGWNETCSGCVSEWATTFEKTWWAPPLIYALSMPARKSGLALGKGAELFSYDQFYIEPGVFGD